MSKPGNIYVEPREQGDYAVRREGSKRASDVLPTQKAVIERARELEPDKKPNVARVRNTKAGGPNQFRTTR